LEAELSIAEAEETQKDHAGAIARYRRIAREARSVTPASAAAEPVAQAAFLVAEEELASGLERWTIGAADLPKQLERFRAEVKRWQAQYDGVLALRRAQHAVAAYFRIGYVEELMSRALARVLDQPCPAAVARRFGASGCSVYMEQLRSTIEREVALLDD